MVLTLKNLIRNSSFSKASSLILGYLLWIVLAHDKTTTSIHKVSLCFYHTHDTLIEQAPEKVTVFLNAKRSVLASLDTENLAAHIDASQMHAGPQTVTLTKDHLLLPNDIRLQEVRPSNICVIIRKNE